MVAILKTRSRERVSKYGEVFTPEHIVSDMVDLVQEEATRIDSKFFEPACGNGNFLVEILRRKLETAKRMCGGCVSCYEKYALVAIASLYGIDILPDNVDECQKRLLEIWKDKYQHVCGDKASSKMCYSFVRHILHQNIICGNTLTTKQADGSPIVFYGWTVGDKQLIINEGYKLADMLGGDPGDSS